MGDAALQTFLVVAFFFFFNFTSPRSPRLPEHRGQRSHLHHLLSPVQGDATGQAAQQGGGYQDAAVDLHQVLPGEAARLLQLLSVSPSSEESLCETSAPPSLAANQCSST